MKIEYVASRQDGGRTLKSLMRETLRLSSTQIRRMKAAASFRVNGNAVYVSYLLRPGDRVELEMPEPAPEFPAESGQLEILYEDSMLLAVNKPQGLIVHPTHSRFTGTLANRVWAYIQSQGGDGCHAVNRLDRDTGGIVLFAKNAWACSRMADAVTDKRYLSIVCGEPEADSGSICFPIRPAAPGELRRVCASDGSPARTDYQVKAARNGLSLLELRLYTGRTHQIRVHCAAMGWPVLGDRLYGDERTLALAAAAGQEVQALWCVRMAFCHPLSGEVITLETSVPQKIYRFFDFSS